MRINDFSFMMLGTGVNDWWDNQDKQIAFCRGGKGFIAFNNQYNEDFKQQLQVSYIMELVYEQTYSTEEVGSLVVKALSYKPEGRGFETQ
jgi:alpha-amylase